MGGRVIVGQYGPKAPDSYYKDKFFVAHVVGPNETFEGYEADKFIVVFEDKNDIEYDVSSRNTCGDSNDIGALFDSAQQAVHQATEYLSMANGLTKQEWFYVEHDTEPYDNLFVRNMYANSDDVFLTHRKDLKTGMYEHDYDRPGHSGRMHTKQSVTGLCLRVYESGVDMVSPDFQKLYVRVGLPFGEDERQLVQRAVDAQASVQLAVSTDGRSVLVNAGELGRTVTRHEDVAVPLGLCKYAYNNDAFSPSQSNSEISGTLVHIHAAYAHMHARIAELKKDDGRHVLVLLHTKSKKTVEAIQTAASLEGHRITLSFGCHGQVSRIRDHTPKRKKGMEI